MLNVWSVQSQVVRSKGCSVLLTSPTMRLRTVIMDVTWSVFVVYLYFRLPTPTLWTGTLSDADIRGAIKKFCNSVWCTNDTGKTTTSVFNTISLHISTIATLAKKVPHSSQIDSWCMLLRHVSVACLTSSSPQIRFLRRCFFRCRNRWKSLGARSVE